MDAPTLADHSYQALRQAIGSGELAPGTKVTERGLAERLGISSTPAREAIRRLELDGLFERLQGSNAEVMQEPTDQHYGVRDCAFRDPAGNTLRINEVT